MNNFDISNIIPAISEAEKLLKSYRSQYAWLNSLNQPWLETQSRALQIFEQQDNWLKNVAGLIGETVFLSQHNVMTQYVVDIPTFKLDTYNSYWNENICPIITDWALKVPDLTKMLDLPKLNSLACETALLLQTHSIDVQLSMPALQIAESLSYLNSLDFPALSSAVRALSSTSLLNDYTSLVDKQYKAIQRNVRNSSRHMKVIEIATDLLQENIYSASIQVDQELEDLDVHEEGLNSGAKTVIQFIPTYLGYAFRSNTNYDIDEEFAKSMICKIMCEGRNIIYKIGYINDLYMSDGKEPMFKTTNKSLMATNHLSADFAIDSDTFGSIVDSLYILIYEGSGDAKRVRGILSDEECATLWNIKSLRTDFRHDIEHGEKSKYLKKKCEIAETYQQICGKKKPLKQKDWVNSHYNLFSRVNLFLDTIIDKLTV